MTTRGLWIALAASVVLNLFLGAALIGGATALHVRQAMMGPRSLRVAGAELPKAERRGLRHALRDSRRSAATQIDEASAARERAAILLQQPTLDRTALDAELARARRADMAVRASMEAGAISYIAGLPHADRVKLAEAMRRRSNGDR